MDLVTDASTVEIQWVAPDQSHGSDIFNFPQKRPDSNERYRASYGYDLNLSTKANQLLFASIPTTLFLRIITFMLFHRS